MQPWWWWWWVAVLCCYAPQYDLCLECRASPFILQFQQQWFVLLVIITCVLHVSVLQLTLALHGTSRATWWQLHCVGPPCTWSVCFILYIFCVSALKKICLLGLLHITLCCGSWLVTCSLSGPRSHHVPELWRQGWPVEHRDGYLPVSGRKATIPG